MANPIYVALLETDWLGLVGIAVSPRGLLRLRMNLPDQDDFLQLNRSIREGDYLFSREETRSYTNQIQEYLAGKLRVFDLPIDWTGYTDFQRTVLRHTLQIPYGETRSYGQVAAASGKPGAARAVGQAEKSNQVPLVIPCHRVIGADGSLTGYGGSDDTDLKARLIDFERKNAG